MPHDRYWHSSDVKHEGRGPKGFTELPYSGKFLYGAKFRGFADGVATAKIKTTKVSMGGENDDVIVKRTHRTGELSIERSS